MLLCLGMLFSCNMGPDDPPGPPEITLAAGDAILSTSTPGNLVIENPGTDYASIINWGDETDLISWEFDVTEESDYDVILRMSCLDGFHGSQIEIGLNGETMSMTMINTGGWSSYSDFQVGTVSLSPGTYIIEIQATSIANSYAGNLMRVVLSGE